MNSIFNRNSFHIKEQQFRNNYDIYSQENEEIILTCQEKTISSFLKAIMRFLPFGRSLPFILEIKINSEKKVLTVKRGFKFFLSSVKVFDENEKLIGQLKQKFVFIGWGRKFDIIDSNKKVLCTIKSKWYDWDYKLVKDEIEFAHIYQTSKGYNSKALIKTNEFSFMLNINQKIPHEHPSRLLIFAMAMSADLILVRH